MEDDSPTQLDYLRLIASSLWMDEKVIDLLMENVDSESEEEHEDE